MLPLEPCHRCTCSVPSTGWNAAWKLLTNKHALQYDRLIGAIFNDIERLDFKITPDGEYVINTTADN